MVNTIIPCKLKLFFHEKSTVQEKETGTNFVLLSQLANMIGQFKKTYLHGPIKTLQFLAPTRSQK